MYDSKLNIIGVIMQLNVIENEFNREYPPLAIIQHGALIDFTLKTVSF